MAIPGSFTSEVYVDGVNFHFDAQFNSLLWSAQIRWENKENFASISCRPPAARLFGDDIEDAIAEWVNQTVVCCIELVHDRDIAHESVSATLKGTAANNTIFDRTKMRLQITDSSLPNRTGGARQPEVQHLLERSKDLIEKFWSISLNYDAMRRKVDTEFSLSKFKS